ncbi:LAME_0G18932g1_1 [Lachancea meyersii CBS 8951]|uniref:LAME_0G18932g1_1 n=1 Tax=Lachancea meyersii CBS 8951 TaxID=1266667 RepID=A0A1G4KC33_9SACH|nr:LAME_0G18932g1_1 [Lachancea meyersii CBS 8951]
MINESAKDKQTWKPLKSTSATPETPAVTPATPTTPPFHGLENKLLQSCKHENALHPCSSLESLESLRYTPEPVHPTLSATIGSKKYINNDYSPYGSRSQSPVATPHSCTSNTSFLKPRRQYTGFQISGYKRNHVHVVLQTVDLPVNGSETAGAPHLTGFFTIQGLTAHQSEITTFFEGFAATENSGFLSSSVPHNLKDLRANDTIDMEHWLNFPSFKGMCCNDKTVASTILDGSYVHSDYLRKRFIYMRWKERFLVPDADLDSVEGASFEGYYYIVHDQLTGNIFGFYYHKDAERFQRLELVPVKDSYGGSCGFEFN